MKNYLDNVPSGNGRFVRIQELVAIQEFGLSFEKMFATANEAFVISGCVVSGAAPNNAVSEGKVFIDGKIHTLPAVALVDLATTKYIKYLSNTEEDSRALFGGGTANTFRNYLAQISNTPSTPPLQSIEISAATPARTFADVFAKKSDIQSLIDSALAPSWIAPPAFSTGYIQGSVQDPATSQDVAYRRVGDIVQFRGDLYVDRTLITGTTVFTLPSGFRPVKERLVGLLTVGEPDQYIGYATISDAGVVKVERNKVEESGTDSDNIYYFSFNNISFSLT